jgi:hypothetical protein
MVVTIALAIGADWAGAGCGGSTRVLNKDGGGDLATASGGASAAGGLLAIGGESGGAGVSGTGGATAAAGATASSHGGAGGTQTGGSVVSGTGGRGGTSGVGGSSGSIAPGTGGKLGEGGAGGVIGTGGGAGSSGADAGSKDASVDAARDSSLDGGDPNQVCEMWQTRNPAQDTLDVQQFGLFKAGTVLEGKLGSYVDSGDTSYAIIGVERVWTGISQYGALASASAIRMDRALYDELGSDTVVIAGFAESHPLVDSGPPVPAWEQPLALLPKSAAVAPELLGFHAWNTPNVAVVRVEETLDGGFRLALVESLRGGLPASFVISVSELWPSLGLTVGSTWIGGFSEPIKVPSGTTPSAVLLELRPSTPDERTAVTRALQALEPTGFATRFQAGLDQAKADAIGVRRGWLYHQADTVAALEVTGIGNECCTGAGGIFHASAVLETLHGQALSGQLLTGGHAYYAKKACGDRFLYAFGSSLVLADGLGLDCQAKASVNTMAGSQVLHELAATTDSLALARQWVASAPPLLRLYPAGSSFPPEAFAPATGLALWSSPTPALTASMAGTPVLLTVDKVTRQAEGYVVRMRTPFYVLELSHLEPREIEVAFACADPRLLEAGTRWIGAVVGTSTISATSAAGLLSQGQLFLVPGTLLPVRSDLTRALGLLPTISIN